MYNVNYIPAALLGVGITMYIIAQTPVMRGKLSVRRMARKRHVSVPAMLYYVVTWMFLLGGVTLGLEESSRYSQDDVIAIGSLLGITMMISEISSISDAYRSLSKPPRDAGTCDRCTHRIYIGTFAPFFVYIILAALLARAHPDEHLVMYIMMGTSLGFCVCRALVVGMEVKQGLRAKKYRERDIMITFIIGCTLWVACWGTMAFVAVTIPENT